MLVLLYVHTSALFSYENMITVQEGAFYIGDDNALTDESPKHTLYLSTFKLDKTEVTISRWNQIRDWAISNGYSFSESQYYPIKGPTWFSLSDPLDYPMNNINWYDCLKWCNARSEFMGRKPVYYTDSSLSQVFRSGEFHIHSSFLNTDASGYRLPTEAEWEKSARGGVTNLTHDYPWGYGISGDLANYKLSGDPFDDSTTPVGYFNGFQQITLASNSNGGENRSPENTQNKLGFYDIIGNVSEWCWDWYDSAWYSNPLAAKKDTTGPSFTEEETGINYSLDTSESLLVDKSNWMKKVHRGGGYKSDPYDEGDTLRIAYRGVEFPTSNLRTIGLRSARGEKNDPLWFDKNTLPFSQWYHLDWYGYFYESNFTWVFHEYFGWIYPTGNGSYDNWIYFHYKKQWLWTSKFAYPWHYDPVESRWLKDLSTTGDHGWFEVHSDSAREKWGDGI